MGPQLSQHYTSKLLRKHDGKGISCLWMNFMHLLGCALFDVSSKDGMNHSIVFGVKTMVGKFLKVWHGISSVIF